MTLLPVSFVFGLIVGSFLNVLIFRSRTGETIQGRSRCASCKKTLSAYELIPVVSFLFLKGRCRSCGAALSLQYPIVEVGAALSYALATFLILRSFDSPMISAFFLSLAFVGIGSTIYAAARDFRDHIIPNGAVLTLALVGVATSATRSFFLSDAPLPSVFFSDIASAFSLAAVPALLWAFSDGRWMGFGDAKLMFAVSLVSGFPRSIAAFLLTFWIGGLVAVILLASRTKKPDSRIPLGPFILLGTALSFFISQPLFDIMGLTPLFYQQ